MIVLWCLSVREQFNKFQMPWNTWGDGDQRNKTKLKNSFCWLSLAKRHSNREAKIRWLTGPQQLPPITISQVQCGTSLPPASFWEHRLLSQARTTVLFNPPWGQKHSFSVCGWSAGTLIPQVLSPAACPSCLQVLLLLTTLSASNTRSKQSGAEHPTTPTGAPPQVVSSTVLLNRATANTRWLHRAVRASGTAVTEELTEMRSGV